jgi:hypothetical protein
VKCKGVLAMAVVGLLGLSATAAQAGGSGGTQSALTSFFVCGPINGDKPNQTVDIESPVFGPNNTQRPPNNRVRNVTLGNGVLACAFAKLYPKGPPHTPNLIPLEPNPLEIHKELKCYTVSIPPPAPTTFDVADEIFRNTGVEANVQLTGIQFVCVPASFTQPQ